jgi:hypothetical protein
MINEKYKPCPNCNVMVSRTAVNNKRLFKGCNHITCICRFEFCYSCGLGWKNHRQVCKCPVFDRTWWSCCEHIRNSLRCVKPQLTYSLNASLNLSGIVWNIVTIIVRIVEYFNGIASALFIGELASEMDWDCLERPSIGYLPRRIWWSLLGVPKSG